MDALNCYTWFDWTCMITGIATLGFLFVFGLVYFVRWIKRINSTYAKVKAELGWGWSHDTGNVHKLIRTNEQDISALEDRIGKSTTTYSHFSPFDETTINTGLVEEIHELNKRLKAVEAAQPKPRKKKSNDTN